MTIEPAGERPEMRIGDRERDAVVSQLQQAHAEGRITLAELDERVAVALSARTAGDLLPLVADLPATAATARPDGPGHSAADPLRLDGGWTTVVRDGRWTVPPFLRIDAGMGTVKVDCLQAGAARSMIAVEMVPSVGTVTVVLPEGWAADLDRLGTSWGSSRTKVPRQPAAGCPLLVFTGGVGMGSFTVRPATRRELRRLER